MKTIKEKKGVRGNYYEVYIDDIKIKEVKIIRVKREKNNFIYLFNLWLEILTDIIVVTFLFFT